MLSTFPAAIRHKPAVRCEPLLQPMRDLAPVLLQHTRALRPEPRVTTSVGWPKRPGAWDDFIMRGNWRSLLSTEADRLRTELPSASSSHDAQATVAHVAELLNQVDDWGSSQPMSLWKWLREWWTGEGSSRAWLQLREAEAELATTLPDEIALCRLPEALADARREIGDDDDPAIREATSLYFETYGGGSPTRRPAHRRAPQVLARLLRRSCAVIFDREAQSLTLRNRIFRVIVVTIVSLALLVWITAVARLHWAPEGNASKVSAFPSAWLTMLCVIVFGVLGGLISAIPVLARPPAAPDPYGLAVYKGTLKLPLGGVFAVIGCLALQSGTLPGVTGVTSLEGLLFWAAAFGASQQAVTRLLDARVGNLLTPPGQATLPHPPSTPVDLGTPSTESASSELSPQTYERGHAIDAVQTTAAASEQATST